MIKLDRTRSCNTEKSVNRDGLTYYQINDSDELCVCIEDPEATERIKENIPVTSSNEKLTNLPIGDYRVTTILLNMGGTFAEPRIDFPNFIQRVYFSKDYAPSIRLKRNIPQFDRGNNSFFNPLFWEIGIFSKDMKELFKYSYAEKIDVELPKGLETIHSYAFMHAQIGTLRIPASVNEIGIGAFWKAKIDKIIFEGKWTNDIDPEAFDELEVSGNIRVNDTAQNIGSCDGLRNAIKEKVCRNLAFAAPATCNDDSPAIGYIRATQSYYSNRSDTMRNEGIIDINTRFIVSVKEYEIPTYTPVLGTIITLVGSDRDRQYYDDIIYVYEPVEMVLAKIDKATKELNANGCTVDELIDRINNRINR